MGAFKTMVIEDQDLVGNLVSLGFNARMIDHQAVILSHRNPGRALFAQSQEAAILFLRWRSMNPGVDGKGLSRYDLERGRDLASKIRHEDMLFSYDKSLMQHLVTKYRKQLERVGFNVERMGYVH